MSEGRVASPWEWPQHEPLVRNFEWTRGVTPWSSYPVFIATVVAYLAVVYGLQFLLSSRTQAVRLGWLPAVHNLALCAGSAAMFVGTWQAAIVDSNENAWMWGGEGKYTWLFCLPLGTKPMGRMFFWSYVYYLSKFYELLDTLILVLRKKPLSLLHVYHHCVVMIMCFLWMEFQQSLQTVALLTNTGIHVVMYFYYFMHSIGMPPPWRKFVTNSQIIQFLFSFLASIPFLWLHFNGNGCSGFPAWIFNVVFNLTLLYLFWDFHRKQYGKKKTAESKKRTKRAD